MKRNDILHSWKEISAYLDRDVRTCHRWEDELGLPIYRIDENSPRSKVFAYTKEIDEWLREKANNHQHEKSSSIWINRRVIVGLAIGFLLLSVFFAWLYFFQSPSVPSLSGPTLTVLPLKNFDASEYEEYFSEGITNEIERSLIRLNKIRVIPESSDDPSQYSIQNMDLIGQKLRPDYLVMGEIRLEKDKILLKINLIRTEDNKNMWNGSYESDQEDIFTISQSISHKIHEELNVNVDEALHVQSNSGKTSDFSAYDTYLKGNFILNRIAEQEDDPWKLYHQGNYYLGKLTQEGNNLAISFFNQAIEIDNLYALAYIGLAQCYAHYINMEWDSDIEWLNKAEVLLDKAQQISSDLPEYFSTLIEVKLLREDLLNVGLQESTLELAERAIMKFPNHPQLNSITGYCYLARFGESGDKGNFEKAFVYKERSFFLNPSGINNIKFAEMLMLRREFYKALDVCHFIETTGSSPNSKFMLGEIYYYSGDLEKSREIFLQFELPLDFKIHALFYLAMIAAQKREDEKALELVQKIETMQPNEYRFYKEKLKLASVYFGLGDKELGYEHLDSFFGDKRTSTEKFINLKYLNVDRNFIDVRNEKRFEKITKGE